MGVWTIQSVSARQEVLWESTKTGEHHGWRTRGRKHPDRVKPAYKSSDLGAWQHGQTPGVSHLPQLFKMRAIERGVTRKHQEEEVMLFMCIQSRGTFNLHTRTTGCSSRALEMMAPKL